MQELKFKNFFSSLIVIIIATVLSAGISYINIPVFTLPIPLLITGLFTGFLVLNFVSYPKATTLQTVQLTLTGVLINGLILTSAIFGINYFKIASFSLNSDFIMLINPLVIVISFLFGFITLISLIKFEDKADIVPIKPEKQNEEPEEITEKSTPEVIAFNVREAENTSIPITPAEEILNNVSEKGESSKTLYEELYSDAKQEIKNNNKPLPDENECFISEETLPSIDFEDTPKEKSTVESVSESAEENYDFIPIDIRLVEAPVSKVGESKGKIASIGKLLLNNRDVESVIESGEMIAEQAGAESKTSIVSSDAGEHTEELFNRINAKHPEIKELSLIDKGGFILASRTESEENEALPENRAMKMNITGALIAGVYNTLQNYLAQLSFDVPEKIFFETENTNCLIIKTEDDKLLFLTGGKEFSPVDFGILKDFIKNEEISGTDFTPLVDSGQIMNYAISDDSGQIVKSSDNTEQTQSQGIISAAFFENIKVFLINIQLIKLTGITIFNSKEVLTVQKFNDEKASFKTLSDGSIKISDDFINRDEFAGLRVE